MKFMSITLNNYIGIYNGMGLYDITIDMRKCKNRITIIRGSNGSGKSTLSKAMSLFPDPNDSFIPGMPARKEIILADGDVFYKLVFIHGVKANGERETTKAYITKTFGDTAVELNENGNVSSYKDILYNELGLDANFAALSQLSNEDRGLADKKPAERKRFVNSIIESLETYNNIYKTLSKRSSNYKSMINSIVSKLNMLGDEGILRGSLEALESKINSLQDKKDMLVKDLVKQSSIIELLDPNNSIQSSNLDAERELDNAMKKIMNLEDSINFIKVSNNIPLSTINFDDLRRPIIDKKNSLIIENQIARNNFDSLIRQKEVELDKLNEKNQRLESLQSTHTYEYIVSEINKYNDEINYIENMFKELGINDVYSISSDEYILALESLEDLSSMISNFKSNIDYHIMENLINEYLTTGTIPEPISLVGINEIIEDSKVKKEVLNNEINYLNANMYLLDIYNNRPETCVEDSCPFIKEAFEFSKKDPVNKLNNLINDSKDLDIYINNNIETLNRLTKYNEAINQLSKMIREIDKNKRILVKMPNGEIFTDNTKFFDKLMTGYNFDYMRSIYQYIDLSNYFDLYKQYISFRDEFEAERKVYESKNELIESLLTDIDSINKSLNEINNNHDSINNAILEREKEIARLTEQESIYDLIITKYEELKEYSSSVEYYKGIINSNAAKMVEINNAINQSSILKNEINEISNSLIPLMRDRDKANHSIQLFDDYIKEKNELTQNYEFLETIKYYSSPTTGIQLVFMELYMGKVISLANELLSLLFAGQFRIQPFVINESEFRIPCLGNGYLNDDISSMSSSQIGMISMILSFALLHHSSTKYNIIKLDEIDGPLDYTNRVYFSDVLNKIMDIMGTEQCIMISHNAEFQSDNTDVILLKHNQDEYSTLGNIIWSY